MSSYSRRHLLATISGAAALTALAKAGVARADSDAVDSMKPFELRFAPHFGMFEASAGKTLTDQLKFAFDHGFRAWEDNTMKDRPLADQRAIAGTMQNLGMEMGVISALRGVWKGVNFAGADRSAREQILEAMRLIVPVAKRVNTRFLTVVPGLADPRLPHDYQTTHCIELLKRCCDIVEPHGLVMVLEPLNRIANHPGVFLHQSPQAYQICKAVGRPSCKILFDIYHQQVTEGNLITNIDRCWDEIAYMQSADNPGRREPGTGEIHYGNVFRHIHDRGYRGIVGMEHKNSKQGKEGDQAVIESYRSVDPA